MKRLLVVLLVIAVTLTIGCPKTQPDITADTTPLEAQTPIIADISAQDAFIMIEENQDNPGLIIIDVRTQAEFDSGHIENAVNLDYNSDSFQQELDSLDKDKTYLVYCAVGVRSASALEMMEELGFMEAYNMLEGINQWQADGLPVTE
jgi:rhodanese-related sulfurtransferase